jgi:hypothetical protein
MTTTKKNQSKPVRLSLAQALNIVFLVEDLAGRKLSAAEDAVLMPLAEQISLVHAQLTAEFGRPGRKSVDKSR